MAAASDLEQEFKLYLRIAKILTLQLANSKDKVLSSKWIKKFTLVSPSAEANHHLKMFVLCLQRRRLVGPFLKLPSEGNQLDAWDELYQPKYFSKMILEAEKIELDNCDIKVTLAEDLHEFLAEQVIPNFGKQIYYAYSPDCIIYWNNMDKYALPNLYEVEVFNDSIHEKYIKMAQEGPKIRKPKELGTRPKFQGPLDEEMEEQKEAEKPKTFMTIGDDEPGKARGMSKKLAERLSRKCVKAPRPERPADAPKAKFVAPRLKTFQKKDITKPMEFKGMQRAAAAKEAIEAEKAAEAETRLARAKGKIVPPKKPAAKKCPPGKQPLAPDKKDKKCAIKKTDAIEAAIEKKQTQAMEAQIQADEAKVVAAQAHLAACELQKMADDAAKDVEEALIYGPPTEDAALMQQMVEDSFERDLKAQRKNTASYKPTTAYPSLPTAYKPSAIVSGPPMEICDMSDLDDEVMPFDPTTPTSFKTPPQPTAQLPCIDDLSLLEDEVMPFDEPCEPISPMPPYKYSPQAAGRPSIGMAMEDLDMSMLDDQVMPFDESCEPISPMPPYKYSPQAAGRPSIGLAMEDLDMSMLDDQVMPSDESFVDECPDEQYFDDTLLRDDFTPNLDDANFDQYFDQIDNRLKAIIPHHQFPKEEYELNEEDELIVKSAPCEVLDKQESRPQAQPQRTVASSALEERLNKVKLQQAETSFAATKPISLDDYETFDGAGLFEDEFKAMEVFKTIVVYCINIINQNTLIEQKILQMGSMPSKVLSDRAKFIGEIETEKNNIYNLTKKYIDTYHQYENRKNEQNAIAVYDTIYHIVLRIIKLRSILYGSHKVYETTSTTVKLLLIITGVFTDECPPIPVIISGKFNLQKQMECLMKSSEFEVKICILLEQIVNANDEVKKVLQKMSKSSSAALDTEIERIEGVYRTNMNHFNENYMVKATSQQDSRMVVFKDIKNLFEDAIQFFHRLSTVDPNNEEVRTSTIRDYFACFENTEFLLGTLTNGFNNSKNYEPTNLFYVVNYNNLYSTCQKLSQTLSQLMHRMLDHYIFECEFGLNVLRDLIYLVLLAHNSITPVNIYEIKCKTSDEEYNRRILFVHRQVFTMQRRMFDSNKKMDSSYSIINTVKEEMEKLKASYDLELGDTLPTEIDDIRAYNAKKTERDEVLQKFEQQMDEVKEMFVLKIQHGADFKNNYYKDCINERTAQAQLINLIVQFMGKFTNVISRFDKAKRTEAVPKEMIFRKVDLEKKFEEISFNLSKIIAELSKTSDTIKITNIYEKLINSELIRLIDNSIIYISCLTRTKILVDIVLGFILLLFLLIDLIEKKGSVDANCSIDLNVAIINSDPESMTGFAVMYSEFMKHYKVQEDRITFATRAADSLDDSISGGSAIDKSQIMEIINSTIKREREKGHTENTPVFETLKSLRDRIVFGKIEEDMIDLSENATQKADMMMAGAKKLQQLIDKDDECVEDLDAMEFDLIEDDYCLDEDEVEEIFDSSNVAPPSKFVYTSDEAFSDEMIGDTSAQIDDMVVEMEQEERLVRAMALEEDKLRREHEELEAIGVTDDDFQKAALIAKGYTDYFNNEVEAIKEQNRKMLEDDNRRMKEIEEEANYFPHGFEQAEEALQEERYKEYMAKYQKPKAPRSSACTFREDVLKKFTNPLTQNYEPITSDFYKKVLGKRGQPVNLFRGPETHTNIERGTCPLPAIARDDQLAMGLEKVLISPNLQNLEKTMTKRGIPDKTEIEKIVDTFSQTQIPKYGNRPPVSKLPQPLRRDARPKSSGIPRRAVPPDPRAPGPARPAPPSAGPSSNRLIPSHCIPKTSKLRPPTKR